MINIQLTPHFIYEVNTGVSISLADPPNGTQFFHFRIVLAEKRSHRTSAPLQREILDPSLYTLGHIFLICWITLH